MQWTIEEIRTAARAEVLSAANPGPLSNIRIDSRKTDAGDVFVAIPGTRFDGHDFIDEVIGRGVRCVIIGREKSGALPVQKWGGAGVCCLAVDDTVSALGRLAGYRREKAGIPVVTITGSNGKTTTKEMTASVCRRRFRTHSTSGNFNNEIGLPLTLFGLDDTHEVAVLEIGMNHPGEIRRLSAICRPDIGLITNIAPAHLEGLGNIETVAKAKGELLENIRPGGTVILNADDPHGIGLREKASCRVVLFGRSAEAQVRAEKIIPLDGAVLFTLVLPDAEVDVRLNVYGKFMTYNALAAAAAGHLLGIGPAEIKAGLEDFRGVKGRMAVRHTPAGAYIIDDTYNANPGSMTAAINALSGLTGKKRGILVAGDMLELGEAASRYHEQIGRTAAQSGINRLYLTGENACHVARGALAAGMDGKEIFVGTKTDIIRELTPILEADDWVLVKGSRSMGMEEVVEKLADGIRENATNSSMV